MSDAYNRTIEHPRAGRSLAGTLLASAALVFAGPAYAETEEEDAAGLMTAGEVDEFTLASISPVGPTTPRAPAASLADGSPLPLPVAMPIGGPMVDLNMTDNIRTELVISQFVDVPVSGDVDNTFRYSGRADAFIDIKGSVFGLDDSFTLTIRPEFTWGEDSNGELGLIPTNTALFRPAGKGDFDVSINIKKQFNSGTKLTIGKINGLDIAGSLPIVGSNGHTGFQNLGLALPPTAVIPNTMIGAMLDVPKGKWIFRFWVFDPDSQFERTGFETAFESGVAALAAATRITNIGGKRGFYSFGIAASTRSSPNAELLPLPLPPGGEFGNEQNELALSLSAYQFLSLYPEAPGKGWGILARFQASEGDPTFLDVSGYFGVAGNPRFRPQDRFGIGYFRYSITNELVRDVAFFLDLEDEQGIEAFYTFEFAKGFGLTANVQVVDGGVATNDTGVLLGGRLTATF